MGGESDRTAALALALTPRLGPILLSRLLQHFHSIEAILAADPAQLRRVSGIGSQLSAAIKSINLKRTAALIKRCAADGIGILLWFDVEFPACFRRLPDLPLAIFVRGTLPASDARTIAIVGTRQATPDGLQLAQTWSQELARRGWIVVSGLARGIDSKAHRSALDASGCSVAVLGSGLNQVYPPENLALSAWLTHKGALISEVHPDNGVTRGSLVLRNRLITAFSRAVIVIECGANSGAMDAARRGHAQGKPIYAPPNSAGNQLLLDSFARPLPATADELIVELERDHDPADG
ncbi:MAG: DNA-processing protein DprA [Anaerolineae bacterium]|nr:DNA-processing protein DprA [Anaerolineae bacterium]